MSMVMWDEISGICLEGDIYCVECIEDDEWDELNETEIIRTGYEDENYIYFCDRCGDRL